MADETNKKKKGRKAESQERQSENKEIILLSLLSLTFIQLETRNFYVQPLKVLALSTHGLKKVFRIACGKSICWISTNSNPPSRPFRVNDPFSTSFRYIWSARSTWQGHGRGREGGSLTFNCALESQVKYESSICVCIWKVLFSCNNQYNYHFNFSFQPRCRNECLSEIRSSPAKKNR